MGKKQPQSNYYAILTADVRYDADLSSSEKIFFAEITALSNKEGVCWASNKYFSELYGVANSTVSSWVKSLKAKGYISVDYRKDGKQIKERLIKPIGTGKRPFNEIEGVQFSEQGYSKNPKGGIQKNEGGYSENPKGNTTSKNITSKNNINAQEKFFEDEKHPLVAHIEENYSRVAKMNEPLTSEQARKLMRDYMQEYPDLFTTEKELKIEIDRVLQELNNHKATSKNISANLTFRKWFNNHIDWHLIPNKDDKSTGKGRLLSINDANKLYTDNFASTNGTGIDFDLVFDHVEGKGKQKKFRVNPDYVPQIRNWNIKG